MDRLGPPAVSDTSFAEAPDNLGDSPDAARVPARSAATWSFVPSTFPVTVCADATAPPFRHLSGSVGPHRSAQARK